MTLANELAWLASGGWSTVAILLILQTALFAFVWRLDRQRL